MEGADGASELLYDVRAQNPGKTDSEIKEVYIYGAGLHSIRSIVGLARFKNLQFLSLHNNDINRIEGLEALTSLKELNLSSNRISVIEGLSSLSSLKILNLSCNRLKETLGLDGLFSLNKLILSHNYIFKLGGISALHGPRCTLKYLDLKDNAVKSLAELWQLAGCIHLEELLFAQGKYSNPVCQEHTYHSTLTAALPHLKYLDGEPLPVPDSQPHPVPVVMHQLNKVQEVRSVCKVKAGYKKTSEQLPSDARRAKDSFESRLEVLETRFKELLDIMKNQATAEEKKSIKVKNRKEQEHATHQVDHTMKGFCRKRSLPEGSSLWKEDHERLGALESRFMELVERFNVQNEQNDDQSGEAGFPCHVQAREKSLPKRGEHLESHRTVLDDHALEHLLSEVQAELVNVKELLKNNDLRAKTLQPSNNSSNTSSEKGSFRSSESSPGKENCRRLERELKAKDAELQKMRESADVIQGLLPKAEKCPPAVSIREQVKVELVSLQTEKAALKEALEVATCLRQNAELSLVDVTAERESLRLSIANMNKALDEERTKLKICSTELESCKRKEVLAHEEVRRLSSLLATERLERSTELEHLKLLHEEKLRTSIEHAEKRARMRLEKQLESLQVKLRSYENELQQVIAEKERLDKVKEEALLETAELKQALKIAVQKEQNAEGLVADLTVVVNSHKLKLQAAQVEKAALDEELQSLRQETATLKKQAAQTDDLVEDLKQQLVEASKAGERERRKQEFSFMSQIDMLKEEAEKLKVQLARSSEKLQNSDDAVRVKTKMLDSQNETIRDLKLELSRTKDALKEAKSSVDAVEGEWSSRLRDEVEQGRALRKELAAQDVFISELEEELKAQKAACLSAEHDYSVLKQKVKEKDDMLRYVEAEINRVKSLYDNREKTIASERDQALKDLELAVLEKRKAEAKAFEAEKQVEQMNATIVQVESKEREFSVILKQRTGELEEASGRIQQLETELKELERQKALSTSKVNKLSKVLDELRAAS